MTSKTEKPNWDDHFLGQAFLTSLRSPDKQTKCGCVIVEKKNKIILGQGYNGFPRGLSDKNLPTTRPEKYPWMIHAETNAVLNCMTRPEGAVAYITTHPCFDCLLLMWQAGIKEVIYATNGPKPKMTDNPEYQKLVERFVRMSFVKLNPVEADLSHIKDFIDASKSY